MKTPLKNQTLTPLQVSTLTPEENVMETSRNNQIVVLGQASVCTLGGGTRMFERIMSSQDLKQQS